MGKREAQLKQKRLQEKQQALEKQQKLKKKATKVVYIVSMVLIGLLLLPWVLFGVVYGGFAISDALDSNVYYTMLEDGQGYYVSGIGANVDKQLVIPNTNEGLPVLAVSGRGTRSKGNGIKFCYVETIEFPETLKFIDTDQFVNCENLTSVIFKSDSSLRIDGSAFVNCLNLTNVEFSEELDITNIDLFAFGGNVFDTESYQALNGSYNESLITEYNGAYYLRNKDNPYYILLCVVDRSMKTVAIHSETRIINASAFKGCKWLQSITIPNKVKGIGDNAFYGCLSLKNISIPDNMKAMGKGVFEQCSTSVQVWFSELPDGWDKEWYQEKEDDEQEDSNSSDATVSSDHSNNIGTGPWYDTNGIEYQYMTPEEYSFIEEPCFGVKGIGNCTASDVVIPSTLQGVPSKSFSAPRLPDVSSSKALFFRRVLR